MTLAERVAEEAPLARPAPVSKPKLPRAWYEPSTLGGAGFLAYAALLFAVPAAAAGLLAVAEGSLVWRVPAILALLLVAQQGLHDLGVTGHEGFHFLLHRNKYVSAGLGMLFSSMVIMFMEIGIVESHLRHHRFTNREGDPDGDLFARFDSLPKRLFLARFQTNRVYIRNTLRLARGLVPEQRFLPFSRREIVWMSRIQVLLVASWIGVYLALLFTWPIPTLVGVGGAHVLAFLLSGLRPYFEHAGTTDAPYGHSRSYCAPILTAAFYFNNLHLEHHLYPGVPCYRLWRVHRLLRETGFFERAGAHVEPTVWGALRALRGRFAYPHPGRAAAGPGA